MIISWHGVLADGQGYSGTAGEYSAALARAGFDVNAGREQDSISFGNASPAMKEIILKGHVVGDVGISHGLPHMFEEVQRLNYKRKIGFTMFETTKFPQTEHWGGKGGAVVQMNKMDEIWTPSEFCKQLFKEAGVVKPIHVVHNGVNTTRFPILERRTDRPFTFLMLGTLTYRKNPGAVLSAFITLFQGNPNVKLILKTQSGTLGHITMPYDNIEIIDRLSTHEEIIELYRQADCFVFPTRGEGFGLPPMEAMATGIPAIIPTHTGLAEYADPDDCYLLSNDGMVPALQFPNKWGDVGEFWNPSYDDLKEAMMQAYYNQDECRAKGKRAAERIRRDFSYDRIAQEIKSILENNNDTN